MALAANRREASATTAIMVMGLFVLLQTGHVFEHVAQLVQKFILLRPTAQGILGATFDLEWVHFLFNVVPMTGLVVVYLLLRRAGARVPAVLWVAMAFQGLHTIEHVAKMYQYYAFGITVGPKGLLGYFFPLIWLHFFLNIPPLVGMYATWRALRTMYGRAVVLATS